MILRIMDNFYQETKDIYRLRVPFEELYTSVFLVRTSIGAILVDCATTTNDVDLHIVLALKNFGYELTDIRIIVLTHQHSDHAGGLARVLDLAPNIKVVRDVCVLCDSVATDRLAGHTTDCIGLLDTRSKTLISKDGLQGAGVGKYRCYVGDVEAYFETITRIKNDKRIQNILFSHAYKPWNKDRINERSNVDACILECIKYVKRKTK